jgi:hypothetical protein
MPARKRLRARYVVSHPPTIRPDDVLSFVHHDLFLADWKDLGLDDDDLRGLELGIMLGPVSQPVISGTAGVRKIRFVPSSWNVGKSGAARACYVVFPEVSVAVLLAAYRKNAKETITPAEKKALRALIQEIRGLYTNEARWPTGAQGVIKKSKRRK